MNRRSVELLAELRPRFGGDSDRHQRLPRPARDGYRADALMTAGEAERYHSAQIEAFAGAEADQVTALTLTYPDEAVGIARAAQAAAMPVAISFTVETDGRLPDGTARGGDHGGGRGDRRAAAYFMINCAHPTHFAARARGRRPWVERDPGLRANASAKSHAELDEAEELDEGDPFELAEQYLALPGRYPT